MPTASPTERRVVYQREGTGTAWFVAIIVALALSAVAYLVYSANQAAAIPLASAHVKIETNSGHGSATHIGGGYFVTAAHVVAGQGGIKIKSADGGHFEPELLWVNSAYDVALLRLAPDAAFETVPLSCVTPAIGTTGLAYGNPMALENITTSLTVAGEARQFGELWKVAVPVDGALAPGMSGGAYVVDGAVVGINVGVLLAPTGSVSASMFGVNVIVPSSIICGLLGRT